MIDKYLQLVNEQSPIPRCHESPLLTLAPYAQDGILLDKVVAKQLKKLLEENQLAQYIIVTDGYRSRQTQQKIWDDTMQSKGEMFTKKYVARPGCSEHELGLAVDLGLAYLENDYIRPSFSSGPVVEKFLRNMSRYGFILRYPKGKEAITGISYEPWHFRYVGVPHSEIMYQQNWTLEEYITFLLESRGSIYGG